MKVLIVGGVAGGASAAARIRRLDEHAQSIMIERSGYVSYANCVLPYYVGGVIKKQEELTLQTPEGFWDRFRIDVRVRQEVTAINPAEKTVTVHALDSGKIYTETYDKLLLAPVAKPTVPALSGVSSKKNVRLTLPPETHRLPASMNCRILSSNSLHIWKPSMKHWQSAGLSGSSSGRTTSPWS